MRDRTVSQRALLVRFLLLAVIVGVASVASVASVSLGQVPPEGAAGDVLGDDEGPGVAEKERIQAEVSDSADLALIKPLGDDDDQHADGEAVEKSSRREVMLAGLTIFVLAIFVGFEMITKVPPTLHTPLMSGSNAISGITVVGALIVAGDGFSFAAFVGMLAVVMATVNAVGGFLVTHRMLSMFIKKK